MFGADGDVPVLVHRPPGAQDCAQGGGRDDGGAVFRHPGGGAYRFADLRVYGHVLVLGSGRGGLCHVVAVHGGGVLGNPEVGERGVRALREPLAGAHCLPDRLVHRGTPVEPACHPCHRVCLLFQEIYADRARHHQDGHCLARHSGDCQFRHHSRGGQGGWLV